METHGTDHLNLMMKEKNKKGQYRKRRDVLTDLKHVIFQ